MRKRMAAAVLAFTLSLSMATAAFAGTWEPDGSRWRYREENGYAAGGWILDQGNWYYIDQDGFMKTGWHQEGDKWYYLAESGAMVKGAAVMIDGVNYTFDDSGVWVGTPEAGPEAAVVSGWNGNTYTSGWMDFQITVPEGFIDIGGLLMKSGDTLSSYYDEESYITLEFASSAPDMTVMIAAVTYDFTPMSIDISAEQMAKLMKLEYVDSGYSDVTGAISTVSLGGDEYVKLALSEDQMRLDMYFRNIGGRLFIMEVIYEAGHQQMVDQTIGSIGKRG